MSKNLDPPGRAKDLPDCAKVYLDPRQTFAALRPLQGADWCTTVARAVGGVPALASVDTAELRDALGEVSRAGARELARVISAGSLLHGAKSPWTSADPGRDDCMDALLRAVGSDARYFTNHGAAEEEEEQRNFLASSFHVNSLSTATLDLCLLAVSPAAVLVLWRFEDD
ncbi:hypothetical protein ACFWIA_13445 [Streptomyces sp. NPDC127068]|uniref:hypothetical protein n=1 Tax=Streptomyces sp. NPDC127068 TaxID=3347127 RepID=UPI00365868CF